MVASHTAAPIGAAKWLERATPPFYTLPLGKGQEQHMSPTQGQADIKRATFAPAISKNLKAFLYGWLPLSDAAGILSLLTAPCILPNGIFFAIVHPQYYSILHILFLSDIVNACLIVVKLRIRKAGICKGIFEF